jgi:hypothetical protein
LDRQRQASFLVIREEFPTPIPTLVPTVGLYDTRSPKR